MTPRTVSELGDRSRMDVFGLLNLNGVMAVKSDVILINRSSKLTHPGECVLDLPILKTEGKSVIPLV